MSYNPFDISFGKEPVEMIKRIKQTKDILDAFTTDIITRQIFIIMGVRGSGKTVLMNDIANQLEKLPDWIVLRLNPERDLLMSMGAKLCSHQKSYDILATAKISLPMFGLDIEAGRKPQIVDAEAAIEAIMKKLNARNKRVLITIDEVTDNEYVRVFCASYQTLIGQKLPVYLLMTGLYENIEELQNEKSLTFLYRAPKIRMTPLNINSIAARYAENFDLTEAKARQLATMTKGYPFAFQALGFSIWNNGLENNRYYDEYRQILREFVYEKIWSELSPKDRKIAYGIAQSKTGKLKDVNRLLGLKPGEINQYRQRLIRKGIVNGEEYGILRFELPLFAEFIQEQLACLEQ